MADSVDHHLKRLDHLQGIVQRLAGNSFLIKGWAVTLVSAVLGFAVKESGTTAPLAYLALGPILLFWGLDAYYLAIERNVRTLYNNGAAALQAAIAVDAGARTFPDPRIDPARAGFCGWLGAATTSATWLVYVLLTICAVGVGSGLFVRAAKAIVIDL